MSTSQNNNWKIAFGVLAGAVAGYWLNSDQGRKTRKAAREAALEYSNEAAQFAQEKANAIAEGAKGLYEQGVHALDQVSSSIKSTVMHSTDSIAEQAGKEVDRAEDKIQAGIEKARKNVKNSVTTA
jgi:gas vesicle protein